MQAVLFLVAISVTRSARFAKDYPKDPANLIRPNSPLDDLSNQVQNVAARAKAVAADARSATAEAAARVSSEQTVVSQYTAEHLAATVPHEEPYLQATVREATKQNQNAATAATGTEAAYNTAILKQKEEVANAASWAVVETEKQLAEPMRKLQEWKMEVLHDPMSEAKIAAEKAARPYRQAVNKLHQRISEYTKRASQLNSQAFMLQANAKAVAGVAVNVMKKPTPAHWKAARGMMKDAQHNMLQAAVFDAQAQKLTIMANVMELNFQAYQAGGEAAASVAAHHYAPHLFAPAPGTGLSTWAPPGPPIPFTLVQTEASLQKQAYSDDADLDALLLENATNLVDWDKLLHSVDRKVATKSTSKASSDSIVKNGKPHRKEANPFQRRRASA